MSVIDKSRGELGHRVKMSLKPEETFSGSGTDRGRSPVEWEDFPYVVPYVCLSVHPPLGHPARPEAQPARPEAQPARPEA